MSGPFGCCLETQVGERLRGNSVKGQQDRESPREKLAPRGSPREPPKTFERSPCVTKSSLPVYLSEVFGGPLREPLGGPKTFERSPCVTKSSLPVYLSEVFGGPLREPLGGRSFLSETLGPVAPTVVSKLVTDRHFFWGKLISNYRYRIVLPEKFISITETDLWKSPQKVSHCRYRFFVDCKLISITDTDFGLETNQFCNLFGYNGNL